MASECDSGYIFLPEGQHVDPIILNEILEANNSFPCNTTGKMEVWTTNPNLQPKSEWECITYVSKDDLKQWECESLFHSLVSGDYEGIGDSCSRDLRDQVSALTAIDSTVGNSILEINAVVTTICLQQRRANRLGQSDGVSSIQ